MGHPTNIYPGIVHCQHQFACYIPDKILCSSEITNMLADLLMSLGFALLMVTQNICSAFWLQLGCWSSSQTLSVTDQGVYTLDRLSCCLREGYSVCFIYLEGLRTVAKALAI